ncbi:alpha-tocopherol transfer protein-like [Planococcus citri]|uniref:alpha-tocopherol transfer protein-like n=1 Tax=Planococcus citri TaxID=170843 RepID=UPI0031F93B78
MEDPNCLEDAIKMGDYYLKFEKDDNLESFYKQKAAEELRETPEVKKNAIEELKRLLAEDSSIDVQLDDEHIDSYLCAYLRICKFHVRSSLEKIKYLFHCRIKYPNYFADIIPINEKNVFQNNLLTISPQRDQHGRRVLILQLGSKWKPNQCSLVEIIRGIMLLIEGAMLEPRTQISGAVLIVDLEGMSYQHVLQFSPNFAKMLLDWIQDSMPLRLKAVHIVKQSRMFNVAFAIFKPFMKEKLRKRIHLHGNNQTSLQNHIDPKYLPVQFGGMMNVSTDEGLTQWNFFCQYNERYIKTSKYGFKSKKDDSKK